MGKRRLARILALNALFQMEVGKIELETAIANVLQEDELLENLTEGYGYTLNKSLEMLKWLSGITAYVTETVKGVSEHLTDLDELIRPFVKNWRFERLAKPEITILRLAMYEILYGSDIPSSVSIDEAIELAKLFGEPESSKFINGILGSILKV
jgi:transcription antitermination protein NusB